jgi:signal transduction histidine kinase/CheY-like chemotaxis protein
MNLFTIDIRLESDVVLARQKARIIAAALKFDPQDQTRIATAVSEIARNTFQYGGGGRAAFHIDEQDGKLVINLRDKGRGIANLQEIWDGKYVSRTGMGLGLIGAKRLMDECVVETQPGKGTSITLKKELPRRFLRFRPAELDSVLAQIEGASQDPYEELKQQNRELVEALNALRARQEELAQLNRELDETNRGVVALYAELNDKADFLQRASELKSHFLSNMSHEFRTPLNSITALSQILLDRLDGSLSPEQEKQVKFIRTSAQSLTELVNDLLDLAKVEAGKVTIRPAHFRVDGLFAALRGMLRPLLSQNSSVNLVFDDPEEIPEIFSDEAKVSQILRNFISNALKFTERGEVRVSAKPGPNDSVVFSVADTGIGIAAEDHERIFEEWTQLEGKMQRAVKGTGLGLPLSRKLAQMLGGNVYVKSTLGQGSTFYAVIPLKFAGATEYLDVPELKHELEANKWPVLVVENNPEALFIYEKYLKDSPFQIVPARNLKEARAALREVRPMAIVLDVLLDGEHTWGLLQDLKHTPSTSKIPVIVVTVVENRDKAMALGADAFATKPVDREWLLDQFRSVAKTDAATQVLVIDDDEVSRYLVKSLLGPIDCRIVEATGGHEGLRKLSETKPEMVILDLAMPDLSGFDVLSRMKADPTTAAIPVIVYTSKILGEHEHEKLGGAVAVLSKESASREATLEHFAHAFRKAGVRFSTRETSGGEHV